MNDARARKTRVLLGGGKGKSGGADRMTILWWCITGGGSAEREIRINITFGVACREPIYQRGVKAEWTR